MKAVHLRTEYLIDPVGIDIANPRIFWNCDSGVRQIAYRIVSERWDSGKVESDSMHAQYPLTLVSGERVNYRIKLWDENGNEGDWSDPAFFEMGLLRASHWQAKWITGDYSVNKKNRYPVDCFCKNFSAGGKVVSARLYITACGLYSAVLNGMRVSMPLAPGITDYRKRVQYQTYDVTALLQESNTLAVELADGWYRGSCGAWGLTNQYGTETKLLAQLEIVYEDGTKERIVTDESWQWSNDGPIRFADNKDGEILDARMEPSHGGRAKVTSHPVIPTASNNVPIAEKETFKGKLTRTPSGKKLFDFGQNIAGYLSFKVNARAGQTVTIRCGELLENGELTLKNIQLSLMKKTTPLQKIEYICRDGVNDYKTTFAIFGFQYAEIDTDVEITEDDVTAIAVYSDLEETGTFKSSNELLNRFVDATRWSAKNNSADLPTDCPTRERHGWLGDAQIFVKTASYLFNDLPFARKFENDICDAQHKNGCFTQIAPVGGVDFYMNAMDGSAGWSDAGVFIPFRLYLQYGDKAMLQTYYDRMKRFADYKIGTLGKWYPTAKPTGIDLRYVRSISNYGQSYGEWAEPADVKVFAISDFVSPHPEETTAYIVYLMEVMAEIARVLGKEDDKAKYRAVAEKVRKGYQKLVQTKQYSLDTDRQAKLVRPLYFRLLNDAQTVFAKERLIKALEHYNWRLGTGFLSTPLILYVLADIDVEYAYRLLENEEIPGWLSMPKAGANTIWEAWEGPNSTSGGIGSLNHYSKGAVVEWLFGEMCGIQVDGGNRFTIAPKPGGHFTFAEASYRSVYGAVESGWTRTKDGYVFTVTVPANTTATFITPDGNKQTLLPGTHRIVF
ncbi:MAG: family 78 glycoside hydrolase catalytic domain [Clostridia bacterium]|nr:family 78 glycoside hydrolase catalytic domain [Clostridia bacterium]